MNSPSNAALTETLWPNSLTLILWHSGIPGTGSSISVNEVRFMATFTDSHTKTRLTMTTTVKLELTNGLELLWIIVAVHISIYTVLARLLRLTDLLHCIRKTVKGRCGQQNLAYSLTSTQPHSNSLSFQWFWNPGSPVVDISSSPFQLPSSHPGDANLMNWSDHFCQENHFLFSR